MDQKELTNLITGGAAQLGIGLTGDQVEDFIIYLKELNVWRQRVNLVSRKDDREIILKDFIDSLTVLNFLPPKILMVDLGSGAGFPGIPLKIVCPDLKIWLLESNRKKVFFLNHVLRALELKEIQVRWVQDGRDDLWEKFDWVVSRAFGSLLDFASEGLSFIKKGGILLAMKGKKGKEELERGLSSLQEMGLEPYFSEAIRLPCLCHERILIGLKKK